MKTDYLMHQVALTLLSGIGPINAKTLLSYVGNVENIFNPSFRPQTAIPGLAKERFRKLNREEALKKAQPIVEYIRKNNIKTVFFTDDNYPQRLKQCADSPMLLYYKGSFDFNKKKSIAIVGTRRMTSYGKQLVNELLEYVLPYNIQVISGLALGVDGYAHKKCLELNIPTIGVLGHGLDRLYPALHKKMAEKMISHQGCGLITEFSHGIKPDRENFPQRNRIVAGMTDATIVIESGKKGGSLITAMLANDYSRDVFAYPGNVNSQFSQGCNNLIANDKAHLITKGLDLTKMMNWKKGNELHQPNLFDGISEEEKPILLAIKNKKEISIDLLSLSLKKPINKLNSLLLGLELKGKIMALPGKKYALG